MSKRVLIVDDEKNIVDILKYNLEKEGYETVCAYDGREALDKARSANPDCMLLDVMLPYMDGFQVCKTLRGEGNEVPIIMLTAREEETDKVMGLELGADDYITKPFSVRELLARVKSNTRRTAVAVSASDAVGEILKFRELSIDLNRHSVEKNGEVLELTQREFELVKFLAERPNKVLSRQELMNGVWQYDYYGDLRTVDVAVRRLREKLESNPAEPEYIITKRGAGYYFAG